MIALAAVGGSQDSGKNEAELESSQKVNTGSNFALCYISNGVALM